MRPARIAGAAPVLALLLLAPVAGPLGPGALGAQQVTDPEVVQQGASDVALDRRLDRLLDRDPLVLSRDTMIHRGDTIRRDVLVLDATLILEGVITGDLVLVDAGAFVRPRSVVGGDLVNIAGGLYRSEIAAIGGTIIDLPNADYRVIREEGRLVIEGSATPARLVLDEFMGFHPPSYDRVNGLTLAWGASYRLPRIEEVEPRLHGQIGWVTERGEPQYRIDLTLRRFATSVFGGYERAWDTNDDWIRNDLRNSLNYLWDGDDYRDYNAVDRGWAGLARAFGDEAKSFYGVLSLTGQVEDASSLPGSAPWRLWDDTVRANPAIDPGRATSLIAAFDLEWHGLETDFEGRLEYEGARQWANGDFVFDRVAGVGEFAMHALADHTLEIEFFVQLPLGGDSLPRQRWSFVGGSGTLQTLEFAAQRGDRVTYVESKYIIPMPRRLALPVLGAPDLELVHAVGAAWTASQDVSLHQEIGARLQFFSLYFRYMMEPTDPGDGDLDIGLSWPFGGGYPWERR